MNKEDLNEITYMDKTWSSQGKFNSDWYKSFQNHQNMKNRLKILELEKQKKVKDIERKLEMHKKNVIIKIFKDKNRKAVRMII